MTKQKKQTHVKISAIKVGRWVRSMWDDVGARDGIIVEVYDKAYKLCRVYFPYDSQTTNVSFDQIIKVGNHLNTTQSGL